MAGAGSVPELPVYPADVSAAKVPLPAASFWAIKVLISGVSWAWPDELIRRFGEAWFGIAVGLALAAALSAQVSGRRYSRWRYWLAVLLVSVAGTEAANGVHTLAGWPYGVPALVYPVLVAVILACWHRSEKTLSLRGVCTRRREMFYWAAVFAAFAAGGALGHAVTGILAPLRAAGTLAVWAAVSGVVAVAWRWLGLASAAAFWAAFIATRPLGTGLGVWLAAGPSAGEFGMSRWLVSAILAIGVVGVIGLVGVIGYEYSGG